MAVTSMVASSLKNYQKTNMLSGVREKLITVWAVLSAGGGSPATNGSYQGGAGGAGGMIDTTVVLEPGSFTVTVGAGGAGVPTNYTTGNNGSNSVFASLTANGGGLGGSPNTVGGVGGCGGGSGYNQGGEAAADGTGQGSNGGRGYGNLFGGGGGAWEGGNDRDGSYFRVGGHGKATRVISTTVATAQSVGQVGTYGPTAVAQVFLSGGGAGGPNSPYAAGAGLGGGGLYNTAGAANSGGGAGSLPLYAYNVAGGSGVVILRLSTSVRVTISAGLTYVTDESLDNSIAYIFKAGTGTVGLA